MNNPICCGIPATIRENEEWNGDTGTGVVCTKCNHSMFHVDRETAISEFMKGAKKVQQQNNKIAPSRMELALSAKQGEWAIEAMPILSNDRSAFERLMHNNTVKYLDKINNDDKFKKVSVESIVYAIEEATIMGAELGKMGDIIPYGTVCQFIPSVEAYEFSLTNGVNAPFLDINIKAIYEGDEHTSGLKNGDFFLDIMSEGDKEKVIKVAVWGTLAKTGQIIGEVYSAKRLLEKAEGSSKPYQKYLKYMNAYEYQKSEGKTERDLNGREYFYYYDVADNSDDPYFEKSKQYFEQAESNGQLKSDSKGDYAVQSIPKKAGGTFDKRIYRYEIEGGSVKTKIFIDELSNPYAGANQPELLRKTAGKSFLRRFSKVRNSEAAMHEVRSSKDAVNESMRLADSQFDVE